jgi:hypothetical protein
MNKTDLLRTCLAVLFCLAFVSSAAFAQQPFDALPEADTPAENQDEPLLIRPDADRTPTRPFQEPTDDERAPDQVILMNTDFAGWQEAATGVNGGRLSMDLRANWMMIDPNGRFEGQVIPGEGADVANMNIFLLNKGRLVKETFVDEQGRFEFNNVRQGTYAIIGWGPNGLFAFGLNVLGYNPEGSDSTPTTIRATAFQNKTTINTDWIQYFAPAVSFRVFGRYPMGEGQNDSAAFYGFDGLNRYQPKGVGATSISSQPVSQSVDGRLIGRVHQFTSRSGRPVDVRSTKVMLLKNDTVYASTSADNFGVFEFSDVPVGEYGVIAVGADGVGIIGINVVEPTTDSGDKIDFCMISSETIGWLNNYASEVAYRRALLAKRRPNLKSGQQYCPGCNGYGCQTCRKTGLCVGKSQSFEDWARRCRAQREITKFGNGFILSGLVKDVRQGMARNNDRFDKAFYGSDSTGGTVPGGGFLPQGNYNLNPQGTGGSIPQGGGGYVPYGIGSNPQASEFGF